MDAGIPAQSMMHLVARAPGDSPGNCTSQNYYDGKIGVRVSAVFVIWVMSSFGALFPIIARKNSMGIPDWAFFIAKFFGSGVIIATAFIHLLAPATDELGDPCLTGPITEYDWPEGIALMVIFVMFFFELLTVRLANFDQDHSHEMTNDASAGAAYSDNPSHNHQHAGAGKEADSDLEAAAHHPRGSAHVRGVDHMGHQPHHTDLEDMGPNDGGASSRGDQALSAPGAVKDGLSESYAAQMTGIFVLEFGIIFHSVFVGLTLAVTSNAELPTLYVVLVFHQTFEGLGLGTRLAQAPWPKSKRWTPWLMGLAYGFTTPIAMAIGLGIRTTYQPGSQTGLIVNGVFDSISAGILIYTGLVELMAHEFMFSNQMQRAPIRTVLTAFGIMTLGAGLMALLGKWA